MQPHICSYIYLVFENITIFLRCESLNHCITCTELTPSRCAHNQKEFCDFKNVPCECSSLRLIQIACGLFYWQNKNALLILPVLHKFYWQNKQSFSDSFSLSKRLTDFLFRPLLQHSGQIIVLPCERPGLGSRGGHT